MNIPTSDSLDNDMDVPINLHGKCEKENAIRFREGGAARKPLKHVPRRLGKDD